MGDFNITATNAGLLLIAKGQTGAKIEFTKFVIGDGELSVGSDFSAVTAVVNPVLTLALTRMVMNTDGTATIGSSFDNSDLNAGFYYRELALFANDPDDGEILYAYGNRGENADWIPPHGQTAVEKLVEIIAIIGNAENVTATIASGIYAMKSELFQIWISDTDPPGAKIGDQWFQVGGTK